MVPVKRHRTSEHASTVGHVGFVKRIVGCYQYIIAHRVLLVYGIIQGLVMMSLMAAPVLVGPYVKDILHESNKVFGISEAMLSVGAIIGAIFWSYCDTLAAKNKCLFFASVLAAGSYFILGYNNTAAYALSAFLLLGFSWGVLYH